MSNIYGDRLKQQREAVDLTQQRLADMEDAAVATYFEAARQLESQGVAIRESAVTFAPGLLQTRPYARAVLGTTYPPLTAEERDRRLVTRLERARLLDVPVSRRQGVCECT
ncbi:hypothetical protein SAM40697_2563 [Streptomyces ambofaciens]|uniref:DUF5753 domain-containing protein n=1 Tax=Streptomyces ambofaciens TaxID=1889 RepID=A0ABM6B0T1_STRAM|nr:hypothetical protein SAM40697_2563 [Streptomyces ambofaciens]